MLGSIEDNAIKGKQRIVHTLRPISECEFVEVPSPVFDNQVKHLLYKTFGHLKAVLEDNLVTWQKHSLIDKNYVYWWGDGIHFGARRSYELCVFVVVDMDQQQSEKELIALHVGFCESSGSWLERLKDLKIQEIDPPTTRVVGNGTFGFWNAMTDVFPEVIHQRCWLHGPGSVLGKLLKFQQENSKSVLLEIWIFATRKVSHQAFHIFINTYETKYIKITENLSDRTNTPIYFELTLNPT